MNTMISTILLSLLAFATADIITIKNNCNVNFEIHDIYGPSGTGILCYPMKKLAVGKQITLNNFYPDEDVILTRASANLTSKSFNYVGTLKNIMWNEEDINGVCTKILKRGEIQVYTVKSGVSHLSLCAIKPKPSPKPSPKNIKIVNTCSSPVQISFMQYIGDSGVYCSRLLTLKTGGIFDTTVQLPLDYLVTRRPIAPASKAIKFFNTLKNAINKKTDSFEGACHEISKTGGSVYTIKEGIKLLRLCDSNSIGRGLRGYGGYGSYGGYGGYGN